MPLATLLAYWLDELDEAQEAAVDEHLLGCDHCSASLQTTRRHRRRDPCRGPRRRGPRRAGRRLRQEACRAERAPAGVSGRAQRQRRLHRRAGGRGPGHAPRVRRSPGSSGSTSTSSMPTDRASGACAMCRSTPPPERWSSPSRSRSSARCRRRRCGTGCTTWPRRRANASSASTRCTTPHTPRDALRTSKRRPARRQRAETMHQPPNAWLHEAVRRIEADFQRSGHAPDPAAAARSAAGIDLYLKDESTHPTGSLKHRLARSLFLYALCNGWIARRHARSSRPRQRLDRGVSEAYFARLLGLPFIAVMPRSTSPEKVAQIEFHGGRCHFVDARRGVRRGAQRWRDDCGGHYMDQFTYAERATDWRGNNNIAEIIFAADGARAASGAGVDRGRRRHRRHQRHHRPLRALSLPRHAAVRRRPRGLGVLRLPSQPATPRSPRRGSRIEGIGRPRVEPCFMPARCRPHDPRARRGFVCGDAAASPVVLGAGRPSTGTNFRALQLARDEARGEGRPSFRCCATPASATSTPTTTTAGWRRRDRYGSAPALPGAGMCQRALEHGLNPIRRCSARAGRGPPASGVEPVRPS